MNDLCMKAPRHRGLAGHSLTSGSWLPGCCPTRSWNAPTPARVTQPLSLFSAPGSKMSSTSLRCIPRSLHNLFSGTVLKLGSQDRLLFWGKYACMGYAELALLELQQTMHACGGVKELLLNTCVTKYAEGYEYPFEGGCAHSRCSVSQNSGLVVGDCLCPFAQ